MRVIYNSIDMFFMETHYFLAKPIYDDNGVDYLHTQISYAGRGLVNGQALVVNNASQQSLSSATEAGFVTAPGPFVSYDFGALTTTLGGGGIPTLTPRTDIGTTGVAPVFPGGAGGLTTIPAGTNVTTSPRSKLRSIIRVPNTPLLTHQTVRHRLCTPRAPVFIFANHGIEMLGAAAPTNLDNGQTIDQLTDAIVTIESPPFNGSKPAPCDCNNGPKPRVLDISHSMGNDQTMVVDFAIETYINEGPLNEVNTPGVLLSNRYSQLHTVDNNSFSTIITEGTALFRTDMLFTGVGPDDIRANLFLPIPLGFDRTIDYVRGREDVAGVDYRFTDVQKPVNFVAGPFTGAATITAQHTQSVITRPDILATGLAAYERWIGLKANKSIAKGSPPSRKRRTAPSAPSTPPSGPSTPRPPRPGP